MSLSCSISAYPSERHEACVVVVRGSFSEFIYSSSCLANQTIAWLKTCLTTKNVQLVTQIGDDIKVNNPKMVHSKDLLSL